MLGDQNNVIYGLIGVTAVVAVWLRTFADRDGYGYKRYQNIYTTGTTVKNWCVCEILITD